MTNEDEKEFCDNCQRHVGAKNFVIHSLHCQRNIELCRLCKEPFPTRDMEQHLAEAHSRASCDKCLQPMEKWQLHTHKETCEKRLTSCQYCLLSLPFDEVAEHEDYCGSRTQCCPECRQFVMKRNEKAHQEMCTKVHCGNRYQECSSNASGSALSVIRNTFSTPSSAKKEANEATSSSVEKNNQRNYGCRRNIVQDVANRKGSARERKPLNHEEMRELIEKTKDVFVECYACNSNVLSSEMKNHLDCCRVNQQLQEEKKHAAETSSSLYHGYLPSYDEVVGNARWSSPHQSQESQEQEASKAPIQAVMEECPVCLMELPSHLFSDHLQYCSERQTICQFCGLHVLVLEEEDHAKSCTAARCAPSTQQLPSHFDSMYEQRGPSEQSYANIMKNTIKNKLGHERRTGMGQNSTQLCLETESEMCPICKSKIPSVRFKDHLKCCSERKLKCHFCNQSVFFLDNDDHVKECYSSSNRTLSSENTKQKSAGSPSFSDVVKSPPNASKVYSCSEPIAANFRSDQKHPEPVKRAEPQLCSLCEKMTHPADENHLFQCLKKSYLCRFCGSVMLRFKFKEHIDTQCKEFNCKTVSGSGKRGKKNSLKGRNYDDFFVKNTDSDSFSSRNNSLRQFSRNTDSNEGAVSSKVDPVMLPCEFCEELVPEEEIILHQSGCRPDLVSYTAKSYDENDFYRSNLNPSDEPVRRKHQNWKLNDDVLPGEYLNPSDEPVRRKPQNRKLKDDVHPGEYLNPSDEPVRRKPQNRKLNDDVLPGEYLSHPFSDDRPIPARKNAFHGSTVMEEIPLRKEIKNEHPSPLNSDLPEAENAFNFTHSVAEDKFNPKPLLQQRLEDKNGLERYLEFLNIDSGEESDSKEERKVQGGEQRRDQLEKVAENSMDSSTSVEYFNDRFRRESAEIISNGNIVNRANPKFAYHANGRRSTNETSACQRPQEELQHSYSLFGTTATWAKSNQDAEEKSYYEKKDYHGKQ